MIKTEKQSILFELENIKVNIVLSNGFFEVVEKSRPQMHTHTLYELHIVIDGAAEIETENGIIKLCNKGAMLILPNVPHRIKKEEKNTFISSLSFYISKSKKENCIDRFSMLENVFAQKNDVIVIDNNETICQNIKEIISKYYSDGFFAQSEISAFFIIMFSELFRYIASADNPKNGIVNKKIRLSENENSIRISKIEEYLNNYYTENITLEDVSNVVFLSTRQAGRIIKKAYGLNFMELLTKMRIRMAKEKLRSTDDDIKVIAEKVGYQSYNGFFTEFKKLQGLSPSEYRKVSKQKSGQMECEQIERVTGISRGITYKS